MKIKRTALGAAVLALTLIAGRAPATQVVYKSPQDLGSESALVVLGKVSGVRAFWNSSGTKILTETTIDVEESFKGSAGPTVSVVQLGGVVGHVRMTVHGALSWERGEEVLVFLERQSDGAYGVAGFSQGKFPVVRDRRGEPFVMNAPVDVKLVGAPSAGGVETPASGPVALGDFINQALGRR